MLPLGMRWAMAASTATQQLKRLIILICSLFGIAALLLFNFITDAALIKSGVLWFAGCYLPVAIAAIYWLYADWLLMDGRKN
ncbi:hypothetical protein [Hymenobacter bucti]|uniref:hypothetical protein n=1 Tax=Hymenobacter bucti TaxID=1844114 RepID=UPI0036354056